MLLSLAAHAVLIGMAALIRFVGMPPGAGQDEPVRVTIVSMAPQTSIKAPDTPAATPDETPEESIEEVPEEELPEEVTPTEVAPKQVDEPAEPEPKLAAPELMPQPVPGDSPEPTPQETAFPEPAENVEAVEAPARRQAADTATAPAKQSANEEATVAQHQPPRPTPPPAEPVPAITPAAPALPASLADRIKPDRLQSVIEQGGSRDTEQAVGRALEWLASAQAADGRWDADRWQAGREFKVLGHDRDGAGAHADTGITGLALLTFLGAGHTHLDGPYQQDVARGLVYLIRSQDSQGCLAGSAKFYARTYSHSMATFALAEAYALTKDKRLEPSVRRAAEYLLQAENKSLGGWRYNGNGRDQGDVSQLGWIIMALRSAELAGIDVPNDTWSRIESFLARVARGRSGGLAAYQAREAHWSRPMTAEAMYCRQILGKPLTGAAQVEAFDALGAELPGEGLTNYYYWYYAALALHHAQDDSSAARHTWDRWNQRMKHELVGAQVTDGSNAGSWSPNTVWGGYGGRVYTTAMAAMSLEVYYRYGSPAGGNSPWVASRPRGETEQR
ncbi:hypothetical protein N9N28_12275 [Rubripirellula amarantea]|nr:hypothetical protein [Rubripirellula amarantea]